tara:strand:- start:705 stop:1076 length:372 start_codon:yes stop_codon:yes gene_type:complete
MLNAKEKFRTKCATMMANAIVILDGYDDLKETKLYTHQLKKFGNLFVKELIKITEPIEKSLHNNEGEIKQIHTYVNTFEKVCGQIGNRSFEDLLQLSAFLDEQDAGNVKMISDEEYEAIKSKK